MVARPQDAVMCSCRTDQSAIHRTQNDVARSTGLQFTFPTAPVAQQEFVNFSPDNYLFALYAN